MSLKSIRARLQLWYALVLLALVSGFGFTAYRLERMQTFRRVDQELQERLGMLLDNMHRPPRFEPPAFPPPGPPRERGARLPEDKLAFFEGGAKNFYYTVWHPEGGSVAKSAKAPGQISKPAEPDSTGGAHRGERMNGDLREMFQFTPPGDCLLVGRSVAPELASLRQLAWWLSGLGAAVLVCGLAGGWWIATVAIRPIDQISAAALQIASGDLQHRINTSDTDSELGKLAGVLNSTFARLDAAFAQQARFTADASHELRTPVTVILTQTQTALSRARSAEEYRETLLACQRAAQRMRGLMEHLLQLARLEAGQEQPQRGRCDLAKIAADCSELIEPLAREKRIQIRASLEPTTCNGASEQLGQVVTNLLTNAIQHSPAEGVISIRTALEQNFAVLCVADQGEGIAPADLPHIFERFFRGDKSRSNPAGRTGLGLAISQAIAQAHGGIIEVESCPGSGATFTLTLPARPNA